MNHKVFDIHFMKNSSAWFKGNRPDEVVTQFMVMFLGYQVNFVYNHLEPNLNTVMVKTFRKIFFCTTVFTLCNYAGLLGNCASRLQ